MLARKIYFKRHGTSKSPPTVKLAQWDIARPMRLLAAVPGGARVSAGACAVPYCDEKIVRFRENTIRSREKWQETQRRICI